MKLLGKIETADTIRLYRDAPDHAIGKMCEVKVKNDDRTLNQNAFAHVIFQYVSDIDNGNFPSMNHAKSFFKYMFLNRVAILKSVEYEYVENTSELDKESMSNFIQQCIDFCLENYEMDLFFETNKKELDKYYPESYNVAKNIGRLK